jgi:hypothetical protein
MAADDFQLLPTWVYPEEPEYHNVETPSESMKKEYMNISSNAVERYKLVFEGLSDANMKTLRDHYSGRYGGYDSFAWKNAYIPGYLLTLLGLTTEDLTGRWVQGSFKYDPQPHSWDAEIVFEKAVS